MIKVSITAALMNKGAAHRYAQNLAEHLSLGKQFWCFGSHGGFERNYEVWQLTSGKYMCCLKAISLGQLTTISERTCNFLNYGHHQNDDEHYQILAIISPNAHSKLMLCIQR
jgi:mRNA interferase YafO